MDLRAPRLLTAAALLLLLAVAAWPRAARADTQVCTVIDTLPTNITAAGHYCLEQDFRQDFIGNAIEINADDVVLDCNDHAVINTLATSTPTGVYAPNERRNVTVRNCTLDHFQVGVLLTSSTDPGAVGNRVEGNTIRDARQIGIYVIGSSNSIERNRILGLSGNYNGVSYGIFVYAAGTVATGNTIRDNLLADWKPTPPGDANVTNGIYFFRLHDTEITDNVISGIYANTNWYVAAITGSESTGILIAGNTILSPPPLPAPLDGSQSSGILLGGTAEIQATNVCRDNVVGHFSADILGCVKDGNTEF